MLKRIHVYQIVAYAKDEKLLTIRFHKDIRHASGSNGEIVIDQENRRWEIIKVDWDPMYGNSQILRVKEIK